MITDKYRHDVHLWHDLKERRVVRGEWRHHMNDELGVWDLRPDNGKWIMGGLTNPLTIIPLQESVYVIPASTGWYSKELNSRPYVYKIESVEDECENDDNIAG